LLKFLQSFDFLKEFQQWQHLKISRNVGGTDNMAENARLFGVLIQYLISFPDASGTNAVAAW
jgi:hypothetical protein